MYCKISACIGCIRLLRCFTDTSLRTRVIKERINIKLKSFCTAKENINKIERESLYRKTYLPMILQTTVWSPKYIKNSHDSTPGTEAIQLKSVQRAMAWCSSVDWARAFKADGCQFDSLSVQMPGLWIRSPVGSEWDATTHWCFSPCLCPSLLLSQK